MGMFDRLLRAGEGRKVRAIQGLVPEVNALEPELEGLTDDQLRARTTDFRTRLDNGEPVDDLLIEAFATVREAARRTIGQRHYDVQLMGGAALHFGWIAEMKTGEGKTLVSTLPVYLNGLTGNGVHVITVNDYLAKRDASWMGQIHRWLGLDVGLVIPTSARRPRSARPTAATSPTASTTSSASTTCGTTWPCRRPTRSSGATPTASSTRSTRSSSTRPARRSSSAAGWPTPPSSTTASPASSGASSATSTTTSTRRSATSPPRTTGWRRSRPPSGSRT